MYLTAVPGGTSSPISATTRWQSAAPRPMQAVGMLARSTVPAEAASLGDGWAELVGVGVDAGVDAWVGAGEGGVVLVLVLVAQAPTVSTATMRTMTSRPPGMAPGRRAKPVGSRPACGH
jgi:hypothetical protein